MSRQNDAVIAMVGIIRTSGAYLDKWEIKFIKDIEKVAKSGSIITKAQYDTISRLYKRT